jgi:hypothetical protein
VVLHAKQTDAFSISAAEVREAAGETPATEFRDKNALKSLVHRRSRRGEVHSIIVHPGRPFFAMSQHDEPISGDTRTCRSSGVLGQDRSGTNSQAASA